MIEEIYTDRDSKIGNLTRMHPEFEPGEAGAEAAQLEKPTLCRRVLKGTATEDVKNQFLKLLVYI